MAMITSNKYRKMSMWIKYRATYKHKLGANWTGTHNDEIINEFWDKFVEK